MIQTSQERNLHSCVLSYLSLTSFPRRFKAGASHGSTAIPIRYGIYGSGSSDAVVTNIRSILYVFFSIFFFLFSFSILSAATLPVYRVDLSKLRPAYATSTRGLALDHTNDTPPDYGSHAAPSTLLIHLQRVGLLRVACPPLWCTNVIHVGNTIYPLFRSIFTILK